MACVPKQKAGSGCDIKMAHEMNIHLSSLDFKTFSKQLIVEFHLPKGDLPHQLDLKRELYEVLKQVS